MKTIKAICLTLLMFVAPALQAQVIEIYSNLYQGYEHIPNKYYMYQIDSLVYVPAQDWNIDFQAINYYKDSLNQIHAVASITIGPDAHLAKAALGYGLGNIHILNDSVPTVTLTAGSTQDVDFLISDNTNPGSIYVLTENKYFQGSYYTRQVQVQLPDSMKTWTSLGKGVMTENFFFGTTSECEFFVCDQDPAYFRIYQPFHNLMVSAGDGNTYPFYMFDIFSKDASEYLDFRILPASETGIEGLVYFDAVNSGYYMDNYGADVYVYHPKAFSSFQDPYYWTYNKVIYWQENGQPGQVQLAPFFYLNGIGGFDYTQANDIITLTFPGYVVPDHSISLQNVHVEIQDTATFVVADLALGADVRNACAIVVPQAVNVNRVANEMLNGWVPYESVQSGTITLPFNVDELGSSELQLVVAVIEDDKVLKVTSAPFTYIKPVVDNSYVTVGTADYGYRAYWCDMDSDGNYIPLWATGLELQQSQERPGTYRIRNWGDMPIDFEFSIDYETCRVTVPVQHVTNNESYGEIYAATACDVYSGYEDYISTYDPEAGMATLLMAYFLPNGSGFAPEYEYIVLHFNETSDSISNTRMRQKTNVVTKIRKQTPSRVARMGKPVKMELMKQNNLKQENNDTSSNRGLRQHRPVRPESFAERL